MEKWKKVDRNKRKSFVEVTRLRSCQDVQLKGGRTDGNLESETCGTTRRVVRY